MNDFIAFLVKYWYLSLAFAGILSAILFTEFKENQAGGDTVDPEELTKMINRDHALVLDLRDQESFQQGHIVDAHSIAKDNLEKSLKKFGKHKSKLCVLVDADGRSLATVIKQCRELGFEKVFGLKGGINAWKEAGMPLISEKVVEKNSEKANG